MNLSLFGEYMFIKRGDGKDGKILSVVETEDMTEEQKKTATDLTKKLKSSSEEDTDTSNEKKSGR